MSSHRDDSKRLCLAVWIQAKVISLSRSLCTLFTVFLPPCPPNSPRLSSYFFLPGFGASHSALSHCLLFILARRLAQAFRKALTNSHGAFPPFCSMSTRCLTPACLVWLHSRGTWQTELLWAQSNRKSMRKDFLCCRGVKQDTKVCLKPFLVGECVRLKNGGLCV